MSTLPRMRRVRQDFRRSAPVDIPAAVATGFARLDPRLAHGARIAVGVGSRGIANLPRLVAAVIGQLRAAGTQPFIIPAMGSHGGATPEGQRGVLAGYGIMEETMHVPIRASLDVRQVGTTAEGAPVFCSVEALDADGIVLLNRIKPHTDFFSPTLGSGLLKMCVVGLGKRTGAGAMHAAASRIGYERAIRGMAHTLLHAAPVLGGVGILEDPFHETARIVVLPREEIETTEPVLLAEARALMPRLPFDEIDLLIVDRLGKNISGAGMDPNVINRSVHGYTSQLMRDGRPAPFIRRIFVRDLTAETQGNATGIGMADVTTTRLVRATDARVTSINALTSLTPQSAKTPIYFDTDREAIERTLDSLALPAGAAPHIVRIADTLSLGELEISEAMRPIVEALPALTPVNDWREMDFDAGDDLR